MTKDELNTKIKNLPGKPGIYIFRNRQKKPLYIGKALNLKNRVKNYGRIEDRRLTRMISESEELDYLITDSDIEALLLESQYIKKCRPPFNIMLRDDKQYFYVAFTKEKFPKVFLSHQPPKDVLRGKEKSKNHNTKYKIHNTSFYIGPFTDGSAIKTTLRLLRRVFPYCTCKQPHNNYCLNYHIGNCVGECCLKNQKSKIKNQNYELKDYQRNIKAIKEVLSGKKKSLIHSLEKEMRGLSSEQEYEKARELQYKIEKLKRVFQNARIIDRDTMTYRSVRPLESLKQILNLRSLPHRIECYDIANIQGKHAVGSMVVFIDGHPDKNQYRKFKIHTKNSPDDTAMLREILIRRLNHEEWPYPDLILVDGGKAQLSTALKEISNFQFPISKKLTVIALTKNKKHVGHKITLDNNTEIPLSRIAARTRNLLLHLDAEAHRFAISYYRKVHRRSI